MRTKGNYLLLAGGRPRGTLYAVNRFLQEQCGVRWWTTRAIETRSRDQARPYGSPSRLSTIWGSGRMKTSGFNVEWGIGRHGPGDNVFGYFVEPNGFVVEYTAEVEQVDEATYQARDAEYWRNFPMRPGNVWLATVRFFSPLADSPVCSGMWHDWHSLPDLTALL